MAYEPKDGSISVFKVNDKEGNENRPDYTGRALIDGEKYKVSFWLKKPKDGGNVFLAGQIQKYDYQAEKVEVDPIQEPTAVSDDGSTFDKAVNEYVEDAPTATEEVTDDLPF